MVGSPDGLWMAASFACCRFSACAGQRARPGRRLDWLLRNAPPLRRVAAASGRPPPDLLAQPISLDPGGSRPRLLQALSEKYFATGELAFPCAWERGGGGGQVGRGHCACRR